MIHSNDILIRGQEGAHPCGHHTIEELVIMSIIARSKNPNSYRELLKIKNLDVLVSGAMSKMIL
jgi:hypothetical protein